MNIFEKIEITDKSRPYGGLVIAAMMAGRPALDLAAHGYVEEEFVLSAMVGGSACRVPILIRKPRDAGRFSGLVVVEAMHAAGVIPTWNSFQHLIMAEGHAWAAIGMQRTAFEQWRRFDPMRYADLVLPTIGGRSWPVGRLHFSHRTPQDEISHAIMTQFGAALKGRYDEGPFAGWPVRHLMMSGNSQTSLYTLSYIRNANPKARLADGSVIWDGFLPVAAPTYGDISGRGSAVINVYGDGDIDLFAIWAASSACAKTATHPTIAIAPTRCRAHRMPRHGAIPISRPSCRGTRTSPGSWQDRGSRSASTRRADLRRGVPQSRRLDR